MAEPGGAADRDVGLGRRGGIARGVAREGEVRPQSSTPMPRPKGTPTFGGSGCASEPRQVLGFAAPN